MSSDVIFLQAKWSKIKERVKGWKSGKKTWFKRITVCLASSDLDTSEMVFAMDIFFNNIRLARNLSNWQNKVLQSGTIRNELGINIVPKWD